MYIFATNVMGLEQLFIASGSYQKLQPNQTKILAPFMLESYWVLNGFQSLEKANEKSRRFFNTSQDQKRADRKAGEESY